MSTTASSGSVSSTSSSRCVGVPAWPTTSKPCVLEQRGDRPPAAGPSRRRGRRAAAPAAGRSRAAAESRVWSPGARTRRRRVARGMPRTRTRRGRASRASVSTESEMRISPPRAVWQTRAAWCTARPTKPPPVACTRPRCSPIRTLTRAPSRPGLGGERQLRGDGTRDSARGVDEGGEELVAAAVDDGAAVGGDRGLDQRPVAFEHLAVVIPELARGCGSSPRCP